MKSAAMTETTNLAEFDKTEWFDVCKRLKPGLTEDEYEAMWVEYVAMKHQWQKNKELQ